MKYKVGDIINFPTQFTPVYVKILYIREFKVGSKCYVIGSTNLKHGTDYKRESWHIDYVDANSRLATKMEILLYG